MSPGPVTTPLHGKLGVPPEALEGLAKQLLSEIPAGRFGVPADIAKAIVFFASDESSFCYGSELITDGGSSTI